MTSAVVISNQVRIIKIETLIKNAAIMCSNLSDVQVMYLDFLTHLSDFEPDLSEEEKLEVGIAFHSGCKSVNKIKGDVDRLADAHLRGRAIIVPIIAAYRAKLNGVISSTKRNVSELLTRDRKSEIADMALTLPSVTKIMKGTHGHTVALKVIELYPASSNVNDAIDKAVTSLGREYCATRHKASAFGKGSARDALFAAEKTVKQLVADEIKMFYIADDNARQILNSLL